MEESTLNPQGLEFITTKSNIVGKCQIIRVSIIGLWLMDLWFWEGIRFSPFIDMLGYSNAIRAIRVHLRLHASCLWGTRMLSNSLFINFSTCVNNWGYFLPIIFYVYPYCDLKLCVCRCWFWGDARTSFQISFTSAPPF